MSTSKNTLLQKPRKSRSSKSLVLGRPASISVIRTHHGRHRTTQVRLDAPSGTSMREALQSHQEYTFDHQMESIEPTEYPIVPITPKASKVGRMQSQYLF
jgi:hypothetical protein